MNAKGLAFPSQGAMQQFFVNLPGEIETIWQPLYDYQTYAAAGQTSLSYFQVPVGQAGKTKASTNMQLAGQLPKGQQFLITGIEVDLLLNFADIGTTTTADFLESYYKVVNGAAWLEIEIGSKTFLTQGPLRKFVPTSRIEANTATTASNTTIDLAQSVGIPFQVVPMVLTSNQNFNVTVKFDAAITVTTECRMGVHLNGYLKRNAQ